MLSILNTDELFKNAVQEDLYQNLIKQLNKDFRLANLNESLVLTSTPVQLKETLSVILLKLLTNNYDDYLNLMYRIDVSEKELATLNTKNLETTINQITFLILKREYQKVWFRNKF